VDYGLVFTAWGIGGVFGSMTAGTIVDATGSYALAYAVAAGLCLLATGLTFLTKTPDFAVLRTKLGIAPETA
jgi:OFA family oxalate/formate antiporter-like MFS transporter